VNSFFCAALHVNAVRSRYTGKERDTESGLDNFGARYFASTMGRFMTPDWSETPTAVPYADFKDPQTLNQYGYVRNNPLFRADVDGHGFWDSLKNCFVYAHCVSDEKIAEMAQQDRDWLKQNCISCYGKSGSDLDKLSNWQVIQYYDSEKEAEAEGRVAYGTPPNVGMAGLPPGLTRMQLLKQVQDPGLRNIVDDLYKDTSSFGEGGTAEAIEYERSTGRPIGGRFHSQKGIEYSRALEKAINSGRLGAEDKAVAQRLLNDLTTALTKTK
jgi:RHS repeat-associated protein